MSELTFCCQHCYKIRPTSLLTSYRAGRKVCTTCVESRAKAMDERKARMAKQEGVA